MPFWNKTLVSQTNIQNSPMIINILVSGEKNNKCLALRIKVSNKLFALSSFGIDYTSLPMKRPEGNINIVQ